MPAKGHMTSTPTRKETKMSKEEYVNTPLPPETAAKLKRIAEANGRTKGREAAQIIIRSVERAKEPGT